MQQMHTFILGMHGYSFNSSIFCLFLKRGLHVFVETIATKKHWLVTKYLNTYSIGTRSTIEKGVKFPLRYRYIQVYLKLAHHLLQAASLHKSKQH